MSNLDSHVPDLDRCRRMAAVPALRDAFKDSYAGWWQDTLEFEWHLGSRERPGLVPAPLVDEMLAWLDLETNDYGIYNSRSGRYVKVKSLVSPNALADACIAAAGESK